MMNRCSATVNDNNTRRNRRCMKSFKFEINGCKCCHIHANKNFGIYVCKIQAAYRSYLCRNKVKKIKEMPIDIQQMITGYVREEFENSRYNCQLSNFLVRKIRNFVRFLGNAVTYYHPPIIDRNLNKIENLYEVFYLVKLMNKYHVILTYNKEFVTPQYRYEYSNVISLYDLMHKIYTLAVLKVNLLQLNKLTIINNAIHDISNFD